MRVLIRWREKTSVRDKVAVVERECEVLDGFLEDLGDLGAWNW